MKHDPCGICVCSSLFIKASSNYGFESTLFDLYAKVWARLGQMPYLSAFGSKKK